jgi:two-component system, OmpR family, sensor kinase
MTQEQARRVFERFYRADQARTRATGGSGLGLAIVASLVAAQGGSASVKTAEGQGATFRITLPLAPEARGSQDPDDDFDQDGLAEEPEMSGGTPEAGTGAPEQGAQEQGAPDQGAPDQGAEEQPHRAAR